MKEVDVEVTVLSNKFNPLLPHTMSRHNFRCLFIHVGACWNYKDCFNCFHFSLSFLVLYNIDI